MTQNSLGLTIPRTVGFFFKVRISRSPVIRRSAPASSAEPTTSRSFRSRSLRGGNRRGSARHGGRRKKLSTSATAREGSPNFLLSTPPNSSITISPVKNSCSARVTRRTSAHRPRVPNALASTLVSGKTLTRPCRRHPHLSNSRELRQTASPGGAIARSEAARGGASRPREPLRCECAPNDGKPHQAIAPGRYRVLRSPLPVSCITM